VGAGTPQVEKFFGVIYRGKLQVYPQVEKEVLIFKGNFCWAGQDYMVGVVNLAHFQRVMNGTE